MRECGQDRGAELTERIGSVGADVQEDRYAGRTEAAAASPFAGSQSLLQALRPVSARQIGRIDARIGGLADLVERTATELVGLSSQVALHGAAFASRDELLELGGRLDRALGDARGDIESLRSRLDSLAGQVDDIGGHPAIRAELDTIRGSIDHLTGLCGELSVSIANLANGSAIAGANFANLREIVAKLGSEIVKAANDANQAFLDAGEAQMRIEARLLEIMMRGRYATAPAAGRRHLPAPRPTARILPLAEYDEQLRALAPESWETYVACRDTGTESYETLPAQSCSTERHPQAHLFRAFLHPYLTGCVLDIGCGPQDVPFYLKGYPIEAISGIDPISSQDDHPFQFVPGYGEFLPWDDASFDVAVSATVLDHYYLLDKGLREVFRVLKPGGRFVAWITHFADAPPYDPYGGDVTPYDHEHMYHINLEWFLPLMREVGFIENEVVEFPLPFRFLFMSFEKPA